MNNLEHQPTHRKNRNVDDVLGAALPFYPPDCPTEASVTIKKGSVSKRWHAKTPAELQAPSLSLKWSQKLDYSFFQGFPLETRSTSFGLFQERLDKPMLNKPSSFPVLELKLAKGNRENATSSLNTNSTRFSKPVGAVRCTARLVFILPCSVLQVRFQLPPISTSLTKARTHHGARTRTTLHAHTRTTAHVDMCTHFLRHSKEGSHSIDSVPSEQASERGAKKMNGVILINNTASRENLHLTHTHTHTPTTSQLPVRTEIQRASQFNMGISRLNCATTKVNVSTHLPQRCETDHIQPSSVSCQDRITPKISTGSAEQIKTPPPPDPSSRGETKPAKRPFNARKRLRG